MPAPEGIAFTVHGQDGLDRIEPLWRGLADYHLERAREGAPAFLEEFEAKTFAARRDELLEKNRDRELRVELAVETRLGRAIGYCVSSGRAGEAGEVESIYVDEAYRDRGIGGALLDHATAWMDGIGTIEQALFVFVGNDGVLPFYGRHGYVPRFVILVRRPPE